VATITVRFYTFLCHILGVDSLPLEVDNVEEAIMQLEEKFQSRLQEQIHARGVGADIKLRDFWLLLVNGRTVDKQNLRQIRLETGDVLQFLPPAAGG